MGDTAKPSKSPVTLRSVECGNGKRKVVVREREYDALSWQGLKTIGSLIIVVISIVSAVLFTYYTAEASQNSDISEQSATNATQTQRLDDNDRRLQETFQQFHNTLTEQRKALDENTKAIIRIDTRQEVLIEHVKKIDDKIDKTD